MQRLKILAITIGIACLVSNSIVLFYTFFIAYLNEYKITININNFGEANIEIILIPLSIILGLYSIITFFRLIPKIKKQTN